MKLYLDLTGKQFSVSFAPEPKEEFGGTSKGVQKRTVDGAPMWSTQIYVLDETGGEIIKVTTAGEKPAVTVGQFVTPVQLEMIPWGTNGKHGVAYRAADLRPVETSNGKKG